MFFGGIWDVGLLLVMLYWLFDLFGFFCMFLLLFGCCGECV